MRINLHSLVMAPAVLAAAAFIAQPAMAESHVVNIPFSFTAAGKTCPAGRYTVNSDDLQATVSLAGQKRDFVWLLVPGDNTITDQRVVLTFDTYNGNHQLRSISYGTQTTNSLDRKHSETIPAAEQIAIGE